MMNDSRPKLITRIITYFLMATLVTTTIWGQEIKKSIEIESEEKFVLDSLFRSTLLSII